MLSQIFFGPKIKVLSGQKLWSRKKICHGKKFGFEKFGLEKLWSQKNVGPKKMLVPKKSCVPKKIESAKELGHESWAENI